MHLSNSDTARKIVGLRLMQAYKVLDYLTHSACCVSLNRGATLYDISDAYKS
jgi:hypothetical protein